MGRCDGRGFRDGFEIGFLIGLAEGFEVGFLDGIAEKSCFTIPDQAEFRHALSWEIKSHLL